MLIIRNVVLYNDLWKGNGFTFEYGYFSSMDFRECESSTADQASSSSSFQHLWNYDVCLGFRGRDTRTNFTAYLLKALCEKGVDVFIDERLEKGEEIGPALFRASEHSRISIVIFSENYASSPFCLKELVKILVNRNTKGQLVFPIFYNVDPSDVRHQRGSFGHALARHEERYGADSVRVQSWRWALQEAANLPGWVIQDG